MAGVPPVSVNSTSNEARSSSTHVSVPIEAAESSGESGGSLLRIRVPSELRERVEKKPRVLHRVPQQLKDKNEGIYEPIVLSLGPYHNIKSQQMEELKNYEVLSIISGTSTQCIFSHKINQNRLDQFRQVEEFKDEVVDIILEPRGKDVFRSQILERVDEIRIFYGGVSREEHDDGALVEMMLRDACFLVYYMQKNQSYNYLVDSLGRSIFVFLARDFFMLENQIPLWVIKILMTLNYYDKYAETLLLNFLDSIDSRFDTLDKLPWKEEQEPLHLLEAVRRTLVKEEDMSSSTTESNKVKIASKFLRQKGEQSLSIEMESGPFRSVTDLKAKGIHFKPSSYCLKDIGFKSYPFCGMLELPILPITNDTKVLLSNLIAFEMSPKTYTKLEVLAYVSFMKSLIQSPKDVKELQEKRIFFSTLGNYEEVVKIFKEIDTYGLDEEYAFLDIKMQINDHCNSKSKTWIAELFHTYFHSPWSVIALLASIFLLCLTFIQTYYTMHSEN